MEEYKVGDLVTLNLSMNQRYSTGVNSEMCTYNGRSAEITAKNGDQYSINLDNSHWSWTASMFTVTPKNYNELYKVIETESATSLISILNTFIEANKNYVIIEDNSFHISAKNYILLKRIDSDEDYDELTVL